MSLPVDISALELEPLRDEFLARELGGRRFNKTEEDVWVSRIAKDIERDERAVVVVKNWLEHNFSSDKRDFCNFVPPLDDEACKLFVRFSWLTKANDVAKARELLREARRKRGMEPQCPYAHSRLEPRGDSAFSAPAFSSGGQASGSEGLAASTSTQPFGVTTTTKFKLPAALRRKQNVSKPTSSIITKRQGAARTSFKKKRRLVPKGRSTAGGSILVANNDKNSRVVSDKGVNGAVGVTPDRRKIIVRGSKPGATPFPRPGTRKSIRMLNRLQLVKSHRDFTANENRRGARARPSQLPRYSTRTRPKSGAPPPKVTNGGTVAFPVSQDQRPVAASGSASAPATGLPSHPVSGPVTARRRTHSMEDNGRGSKRTRIARRSSAPNGPSASSSAKTRTPSDLASSGPITELDRGLARIGAMAQERHVGGLVAPVYSFDNAADNIPEDEDDPHGATMASEYLSNVYVGPEEPEAAVFPKQLLPVQPPIWAQSRQEVCESLDSFRSFQGGVYHIHDIVKGYLLGGHSSSRDLFYHSGKLIISHGGGKAEALHSKNRCLEVRGAGDQLEDDRSVRALLNNYKSGRPLVLLADDNYRLFPFDLTANGYTYVVLGLYWITHAWAELQQVNGNRRVVRYKFAFQWCEGQGDPWWPQDTEPVSADTQAEASQNLVHEGESNGVSHVDQANSQLLQPEITAHHCLSCRMSSPLVYQDTPMCLQPSCPQFSVPDPAAVVAGDSTPSSLSYSAELLRLRPANHVPVSAASFFPPSPSRIVSTPRPFAKGLHCQDCGRLSTRFKWEDFECSHCHRIYKAPNFHFTHKDFWLQEQTLKFFQHRIAEDSGIVIREMEFQARKRGSALPYVQTFVLPYDRGRVHLIPGHPSINKRADDLFGQYQKQAAEGTIQFRRWPLRSHKCRGQLLSNYFSQNTGAPYQYIGGAERTTPLKDGAEAVLGALDLIKHRIVTTLGMREDFNEVLSAAYMEKQKMTFHSDSERGLGPVVASLSLGCVAEMHFRLHSKYTVSDGHRKVAMSLILRHGDVLVMDGAGVQEYYEHAVVPKNFRIVATARSISPENYNGLKNDGHS
ncbi:hypothetical protein EDB87DRAFT_115821 [Lactarius vividus]|nr:hypothetical protein EDB87DRAFT_115821 [Lactarius vividus]